MHIKQITISNFRSFRQQAEIQPFSAATNAVVGRNGSGKSNLFDAVQFCLLAPRFVNLRQVNNSFVYNVGCRNMMYCAAIILYSCTNTCE
jgi:structural maintenance of chromosome 3 (chondroitin sulfate proteoglycan 6)